MTTNFSKILVLDIEKLQELNPLIDRHILETLPASIQSIEPHYSSNIATARVQADGKIWRVSIAKRIPIQGGGRS